jgi:hypothetical protein
MDLNHQPLGPEEGGIKHLSAASGVAYGTPRPFTLLLKWTEVGRKIPGRTSLMILNKDAPVDLEVELDFGRGVSRASKPKYCTRRH